jgi:hypothetical protein
MAYRAASQVFGVSSRVASAANGYRSMFDLTRRLWSVDSALKELLETFYREEAKAAAQGTSEPPSPEKLDMAINTLVSLCGKIDELYAMAKAKGLTNRTLVGTVLNSICVRNDDLRDIVESVQLSKEPEVDRVFERAAREFESDQTFDLASIK